MLSVRLNLPTERAQIVLDNQESSEEFRHFAEEHFTYKTNNELIKLVNVAASSSNVSKSRT